MKNTFKKEEDANRKLGNLLGYKGGQGGWIYRVWDGSWKPVVQGWNFFTSKYPTLAQFVTKTDAGYRVDIDAVEKYVTERAARRGLVAATKRAQDSSEPPAEDNNQAKAKGEKT